MEHSGGLKRNIVQCLNDFNIPLLTRHTITKVVGKDRVEGVFFAQVDDNLQPIKSTEKFIKCDTVILSVGLIPEKELLSTQVELSQKNNSFIVDENRECSLKGIFVSGNVLHIHDLADNATEEGKIAGLSASNYAKNQLKSGKKVKILFSDKINYTIPQRVNINKTGSFVIYFRSNENYLRKTIIVKSNEKIIAQKFCVAINIGELQEITVNFEYIKSDLILDII